MMRFIKAMANYQTLDGLETTDQDKTRGVWYSANVGCGYWTDNWDKLEKIGMGIPCCPVCHSVGFQTTWEKWMDSISRFEAQGHPSYLTFCLEIQEKCGAVINALWISRYEAWKRTKGI